MMTFSITVALLEELVHFIECGDIICQHLPYVKWGGWVVQLVPHSSSLWSFAQLQIS